MKPLPRICVLASGGGRSIENLAQVIQAGSLQVEIGLVLTDRPEADALARSKRLGHPSAVVKKRSSESNSAYSKRIFETIGSEKIDLVVLAGFLKLLVIPVAWRGRVINIHPSLLPAFGGQGFFGNRVHQAVLERGVEVTGCTVHYVDDEYDHGRVLLQRWIPVPSGATTEQLAAAVFEEEKHALPAAIARHFSR